MSTQQMIRVNGKTQYIIMLSKDSCTHTNEDDDAWLDRLQQLYEAEHENDNRELPEMSEDEDMIEFDAKERKHANEIEYDVKLMRDLM